MILPGFHARLNLHRFVGARHHSHKHLPGLRMVLSLQVFIHTVFYVRSQSRRLQPYNEKHSRGRGWNWHFENPEQQQKEP